MNLPEFTRSVSMGKDDTARSDSGAMHGMTYYPIQWRDRAGVSPASRCACLRHGQLRLYLADTEKSIPSDL